MTDFDARSSEDWEETRIQVDTDGGGRTLEGYVAVFNTPSRLLSELDLTGQSRGQLARFGRRTFREVIHPGAFSKSLAEQPDIVLHYQHDEKSLPLARTRAGTMTLSEDTRGIRVRAELPDNEWGRPVRDAVARGDIGGLSFRMGGVIERWSDEKLGDYSGPVRHLHEIRMRREVSFVTFGGYDTPTSIRELAEAAGVDADELGAAFAILRSPDDGGQRLTLEQRDLLVTTINARTDAPVVDASAAQKLAQMRERLAALAAG